ncbi:MAG: hypothetical protein GTO02_18015, partial [Candidatus Dadabacteria bacterium]|nr:hypothetical protein [Candidatus Dadabacteria bacterium]NIQ16211.1 hypothetical protein [Candidatus Dadabacteria bacterium]
MNIFRNFLTIVFLLLFSIDCFAEQDLQSQVEMLKKQIESIQKSNQETIERLQRESNEQINSLKVRINELEKQSQQVEVKEESGIKDSINKFTSLKKDSKGYDLIDVTYSKDLPSYFRTRARYINDGTFLGASDSDDEIFFVDSRFMFSPKLNIGENLSVRAQFDIFKNVIWGGFGDEVVSDVTFEAPTPNDSFRGALLRDSINTLSGDVISTTENVDLVDIRSLYFVGRVPYGEFWVGRFPFDWGLGIFNNAGSLPDQDLGSL